MCTWYPVQSLYQMLNKVETGIKYNTRQMTSLVLVLQVVRKFGPARVKV